MILDQLLRFDPPTTAVTASAASTNVVDLINFRDIAVGACPDGFIHLTTTIQTAFTAAGAATLTIQLQMSVDNATWTTVSATDAIPKASLLAGTQINLPLGVMQPQSAGIPRYLRAYYVVATGPFTAGTLISDLVIGSDDLQPSGGTGQVYQSGYGPGFTVAN